MLWSSEKLLIFKYICLFCSTFPERHAIVDHAIPEAVKKMDSEYYVGIFFLKKKKKISSFSLSQHCW